MNVFIIDSGHHEVIRLLLASFRNRRDIMFTLVVPDSVKPFLENREEKIGYAKSIDDLSGGIITQGDRVIFSTITSKDLLPCLKLAKALPSTVHKEWIVHNLNNWIIQPHAQKNSLRKNHRRKRVLLSMMNRISVLDYPLKQYLVKSGWVIEQQVGLLLPASDPKEHEGKLPKVNSKFSVLIPGAVLGDRRNYIEVFKALNQLDEEVLLQLELCLLGAFPNKPNKLGFRGFLSPTAHRRYRRERNFIQKSEKWISDLRQRGLEIITHDHEVPQKIFDKKLCEADLIIAPTVKCIEVDGVKEYYGITKFSGSINDIRNSRKKAIIPSHIWHEHLDNKHISIYQDSDEMARLIKFQLKTSSSLV